MSCDCRVSSKVPGAGGLPAQLGCGIRYIHYAGDWSAVATSVGSL